MIKEYQDYVNVKFTPQDLPSKLAFELCELGYEHDEEAEERLDYTQIWNERDVDPTYHDFEGYTEYSLGFEDISEELFTYLFENKQV